MSALIIAYLSASFLAELRHTAGNKNRVSLVFKLDSPFGDLSKSYFSYRNKVYSEYRSYYHAKSILLMFQNTIRRKEGDCHLGRMKYVFNDPDLYRQWYFLSPVNYTGSPSHKLDRIWSSGITGVGSYVALVGGGVEFTHKDLLANHEHFFTYNFVYNSSVITISRNGKPTQSIGLVSAVSDNSECGAGAAPSSKFANLQILDDLKEESFPTMLGIALGHMNQFIHIYLINWIVDPTMEPENTITSEVIAALEDGLKFGRRGLGSIFILGSGDSGSIYNHCGFNGLIQRPEVFVFGSFNSYNSYPEYLEKCTAVLAVSISTDQTVSKEKLYSTNIYNTCGYSAGGSFASASITAGIIALLISFDSTLTSRQIMISIILTSDQCDLYAIRNAQNYYYSYFYGFGAIQPERLFSISQSSEIKLLPPERKCLTFIFDGFKKMVRRKTHTFYIYTSGCLDSSYCVTNIEQLFIRFSLATYKRNNVRMLLTSPSGTKLSILERRNFDKSKHGFKNWMIKILGFYDEKVSGVWILEIILKDSFAVFSMLELIYYGKCVNPYFNLDTHSRIMCFIKNNKDGNKTEKLIERCSSHGLQFKGGSGRDYCSFTGAEYDLIYRLISFNFHIISIF